MSASFRSQILPVSNSLSKEGLDLESSAFARSGKNRMGRYFSFMVLDTVTAARVEDLIQSGDYKESGLLYVLMEFNANC